MDLTTMTPAEIDAVWAPLHYATVNAYWAEVDARESVRKLQREIDSYTGTSQYYATDREERITNIENRYPKLHEAWTKASEAEVPFETEWDRRGGWTRAYLVITSSQGHVHTSMSCSTCYPTTRFEWLAEQSGMSQDEIVELAGERACTVCYPSAPVEIRNRPTKLFGEDEKRRQAEQAARKQKQADKATQAVLDADGKPLFKTERGATNAIASTLDSMVHYGPTHPSFTEWQTEVETIVAALKLRGVEFDVEAKLAQIRDKVRREHKKFIAGPIAASYRAQGILKPEADEPGYDPAKY